MGRGDDAHVDLDRRVAAHPVELAVSQYAQQAGLRLCRHVADLIQKQGAAIGLLKATAALYGSTGEGALLVTEQLGFHQVFRNRCHVQGDEGVARARAVAVQGVGDQLFTGTGFAVDQHRDVGVRQAADGAKDLLHGWRFTDDLGGAGLQCFFVLRFLLVGMGQRAADQGDGLVYVKGLGQVLEGTTLVGGNGAVEIRVGGHDDHWQLRITLAHGGQQIQAAGAGHADVADENVRMLALQTRQGGVCAVKGDRLHAFLLQGFLQYPADGAVVVDDPDVFGTIL